MPNRPDKCWDAGSWLFFIFEGAFWLIFIVLAFVSRSRG
jgi:hypothetical protein